MSSPLKHLTLSNGLRVRLRHAPHLKRCAALVRVHAGSHDAPVEYPGLAHFLEHLFFLGTARFPVEDGLMRVVQRQGGQLNASTRERTTEFFFEAPVAAMAGALERLCEMLAHPLLTLERQQAEREVIHAEWVAWTGNAEAQRQYALLRTVSSRHPLSGFHAGNRDSLPVHDANFQRALTDFHRRFYQAGQLTLSLSGPQPLDELERLARQFGGLFAAGCKVEQKPAPPLLDGVLQPPHMDGQLDVLIAHEALAHGAAIDYLKTWITDSQPGGLVSALRERGWLEDFSFTSLYEYAGQALLHIRVQLSATADRAETERLIRDWLAFFSAADHRDLLVEYRRRQEIRNVGALELARQDDQAPTVLKHPGTSRHPWKLPEPEPLLAATLPHREPTPVPAGLVVSTILPPARHYAALYIRWHFDNPAEHLHDVLKPLIERASRAAVELQWTRIANTWQLRCTGPSIALLAVVDRALTLLENPTPSGPPTDQQLIPIRALMQELPHLLPVQDSPGWTALAIGFDRAAQNVLNHLLAQISGHPRKPVPPAVTPGQWHQYGGVSDEHALLLFYPMHDEAAGRLLAQLIQGPFYHRLRSELQLGYAVFSAFRQIQGQGGLMCGVQSPGASHGDILSHLHDFFARPSPTVDATRELLAAQFHEPAMANADIAEWLWQRHLAGNDTADPDALANEILKIDQARIDTLWSGLAREDGWLILANGPPPGRSLPLR